MGPVNLKTDKVESGTLCVVCPEGEASISQADLDNGSPKEGDMIARNPKNHSDVWLVAKKYFEENLEEI